MPPSGEVQTQVRMLNGRRPVMAVIALGGYAPCEQALMRGMERLAALGFEVCNFYDPQRKHLRFGGTDEARVAQLHAAADAPEVDVIMALRGGYGMSRLLPHIDYRRVARSGKLLIGHSDFTALQMALLAETGMPTFAGPMVCDDFTAETMDPFMWDHFCRCLQSPSHRLTFAAPGNPAVEATGMLWGGNLAMLTHLAGSRYLPSIDGGLLFVEDVNEHPYRVERMLLQLLHSGILARQKALVLGDFSRYRLSDYDNGYDFAAMLSYLRATLPLPVIEGLPFGHVPAKATLPVGSVASLFCDGSTAVLDLQGNPILVR